MRLAAGYHAIDEDTEAGKRLHLFKQATLACEMVGMIESLFVLRHVRARHREAPMLNEREEYLSHLLRLGATPTNLQSIAAYLLNIVRLLEMTCPRSIAPAQIQKAIRNGYLRDHHDRTE
jgi:hypothetical protein